MDPEEQLAFDASVAEMFKGQNFKQCPQCNEGIVKDKGCEHMTCACGYEFCWQCRSGGDPVGRHRQMVHLSAFHQVRCGPLSRAACDYRLLVLVQNLTFPLPHQNECMWFTPCCIGNCMLRGSGNCRNGQVKVTDTAEVKVTVDGEETKTIKRCPVCEESGSLCTRHTPKPEHLERWRVGDKVTYYFGDGEAGVAEMDRLVDEVKASFDGRLPDSKDLADLAGGGAGGGAKERQQSIERYLGRSVETGLPIGDGVGQQAAAETAGRRRATVVSVDRAPAVYGVRLDGGGGGVVPAAREQLSHLTAVRFPECSCTSCVWFAREEGNAEALAFRLPGDPGE